MSDDITRNYHGGNPASVAAHEQTKPRKSNDFLRILQTLHRHPKGLTCDETEQILGMAHQTCSARFSEMKSKGWISQTGEMRATRNLCNAWVYVSTPNEEAQL